MLLWIYLGGVASSLILSHGLLSNPKVEGGADVPRAMWSAILWPLMLLTIFVKRRG